MPSKRFRLSTVFVAITLFAIVVVFVSEWLTTPRWIGPCLGQARLDYAAPPHGIVGLHSVAKVQQADGGLAGVVVAVVDDVKEVTPELLERTLEALPDKKSAEVLHFIELINPVHASLRSFDVRHQTELPDHLPGALASVMVLDQLAFRLLPEERVPFGQPGSSTTIDFSSGNAVDVEYTNDWGYVYLRRLDRLPQGWKFVRTVPYEPHEIEHASIAGD